MRDQALLRDLLNNNPRTSLQELAQAIGRSASWVKQWRKRLREGDPHDQELVCSRSRAHHAPYFRSLIWTRDVFEEHPYTADPRESPEKPRRLDGGCMRGWGAGFILPYIPAGVVSCGWRCTHGGTTLPCQECLH